MAKTIKAVFGVGECTKVCPQWQYDYNTVLQFVGLDLPANYEVDLSNSKTGQSTTVLGDENGCVIPAQYFIPGSSIFAWVYLVGNNYGFTRAQVEIPIHPRAQHTGDPPTPEQQDALDEAIALLNSVATDIQGQIDSALQEAKDSGEFDGPQGPEGPIGLTGPEGPGVSDDLRAALIQLAAKIAYIDDGGATYYQDLYNALYNPPNVAYITAVFNQGTTKVYSDTPLDDLKPMLTVFGFYDNNTWQVLTNYTLTGTLSLGTSSVTVTALGKTTTFDVLVTELTSISAVYTQSGTVYDTDTLDSLKADLVVTAHYSDSSTQTVSAADYTLSGILAAGTSTITVSYGGKTTTFNVTVAGPLYPLENGTHTFTTTNRTLTVTNGKLFAFTNGSAKTSGTGGYLNLTTLSDNDNSGSSWSNVSSVQKTIFTIPAGAYVEFHVRNIVATCLDTGKYSFEFIYNGASISPTAIKTGDKTGTADVTVQQTVETDTPVSCIYMYIKNSYSSFEADIELYVNNVRWI